MQYKYPGVKVVAKIEEYGPRFTVTSYDKEKNLVVAQEIQEIFKSKKTKDGNNVLPKRIYSDNAGDVEITGDTGTHENSDKESL